MKRRLLPDILVLCGVFFLFFLDTCADRGLDTKTAAADIQTYTPPLYFIPNQGQVHEEAKFYARTSRYTLWMTKKGLVFDSSRLDGLKPVRTVYRMVFPGGNYNPGLLPMDFTGHHVNYLKGNSPSRWFTGLKTANTVLYKNLYKNIDLKVYGSEKQIEYDWIVKPGADPDQIRFRFETAENSRVADNGDIIIETPIGELTHKRPVSYQIPGPGPNQNPVSRRRPVKVTFKKIDKKTYGFEVDEYDKNYELIIDPVVLVYSTYLGGSGDENANGLAVDNNGCAYITGETRSTDFPVVGAYQGTFSGGSRDAYVTKFSADGKSLVYSTFIGGSGDDVSEGIQLDSSGKAYITGITGSADFPVKNAYRGTYAGGANDAFVLILSPSGGSLTYASYLGGSGDDQAYAIALDSGKNIYITGQTGSTDFPAVNAYKGIFTGGGLNEYDAFVTKIAPSGSSLVYSTYLGGSGKETAWAIALKGSNAYVAGRTTSTDFPTKNKFQGTFNGGVYDAFVTQFSASGSSLIYSTYLGGSKDDTAWGLAVDDSGCAYAAGTTSSTNFPAAWAYQNDLAAGDRDMFLTKFTATGQNLEYSTYLGGSAAEAAAQVLVNDSGYVYLTGYTSSPDFPTKRAYQNTPSGGPDAVAALFNSNGDLIFSTFLGGSAADSGKAIAVENSGNIYVAGYTQSTDFPRVNAYQPTRKGGKEAFMTKLATAGFGSLCGAVDNCDFTWTTGGDVKWFEQVDDHYYDYAFFDGDAAQCGRISPSQSSYLQTTVTGPGQFRFFWKISFGYVDKLNFYKDNVLESYLKGISGGDWHFYVCEIPAGSHTLKWAFERSIFGSESTKAWVDQVEYTQGTSIVLSRRELTFGAAAGTVSEPQTFSIKSSVPGTLFWTHSHEISWLYISPVTGFGNNLVSVTVDASGLPAGTYKGAITISAAGAVNNPQTVSVTLHVYGQNLSKRPFGTYETPTNNSTISSSAPFSGWVLDDVGVDSVKIYRQEGSSLAYIGDAVLVEGARPDVEPAYPGYPNNYKAGWGYMMLTNFLPNNGNGSFNMVAIATDVEGHQAVLGTKTVTVDNAHAVKPFGAIDTPAQGGSISGDDYVNWGWVLTPRPNSIPTDGSTLNVWVDGVYLGQPHYNIYRSDIAGLFPGYVNSGGAAGYFLLDSTAYADGVHTIQWTATDTAGNTDGLGSRYFITRNSASSRDSAYSTLLPGDNPGSTPTAPFPVISSPIQDLFMDSSSPVGVVIGYHTGVVPADIEMLLPDDRGLIIVDALEMDRIELHLGWTGKISGCLKVGNQYRPLPSGSCLDPIMGIFYWQMGVAYLGRYHLVFVVEDEYGCRSAKNILVKISPRY